MCDIYRKLVRYCHPDKFANGSNAANARKLLANKVFGALTDAYNRYKTCRDGVM